MGVYKRKLAKGVRYFYSGQYKGMKYFSQAIYTTRGDCMRAERDKLAELERNYNKPQNEMTLSELMDARLDEVKQTRSEKYYHENRRYYKILLKHIGDIPITAVRKAQINELLLLHAKKQKKNGFTNHGANTMLRSLKALFNYGIRIHDIEMLNPCVGIGFMPIEIKLKHIPSDLDIISLRDSLDKGERFIFDFVDQTGCRINEALRLKYEDIEGNLLTLWTHKSKNSNLTPRRIPVPPCLEGRKGKGRVFNRWDDKPKFLERHIKTLKLKKWSWHNLRHRRASIWASEGRMLLEIMQLLGHTNLSTTQKYLQILGHIKL